jgi:hypothetical protein
MERGACERGRLSSPASARSRARTATLCKEPSAPNRSGEPMSVSISDAGETAFCTTSKGALSVLGRPHACSPGGTREDGPLTSCFVCIASPAVRRVAVVVVCMSSETSGRSFVLKPESDAPEGGGSALAACVHKWLSLWVHMSVCLCMSVRVCLSVSLQMSSKDA